MDKEAKLTVTVQGLDIAVRRTGNTGDYISLTDIARHESDEPNAVIQNWMRNQSTIEYLDVWETVNNPSFDTAVSQQHLNMAGKKIFTMSPKKWIDTTRAIGIESKAGRYGGTYAHEDIAFEFLSWISPKFRYMFTQDYKRLKGEENQRQHLSSQGGVFFLPGDNVPPFNAIPFRVVWNDAYLELTGEDLCNVAMFGITQEEFKKRYPASRNPVRGYSSVDHIISFSTLLTENSRLEREGVGVQERLIILNQTAIDLVTTMAGRKDFTDLTLVPPIEAQALPLNEPDADNPEDGEEKQIAE